MKNSQRIIGTMLLFFGSNQLFAQTTNANTFGSENDFFMLFAFTVMTFLAILLVVVFSAMFSMLKELTNEKEKDVPATHKISFLEKLANLKPLSQEKELLLHEDYDGIQELDNPVPNWFNALFYGTVVIGIFYLFVYHSWNSAPLQKQEYDTEVNVAQLAKAERLKNAPADDTNETNVKLLTDAGVLNAGKGTYLQYCAACHGKAGEGGVGPNLTDEYWLHGGTIQSVFKTIKYGVAEKGMVAWGTQITPTQMSNVANFILSLKGTNPPNGKAPQGKIAETK